MYGNLSAFVNDIFNKE